MRDDESILFQVFMRRVPLRENTTHCNKSNKRYLNPKKDHTSAVGEANVASTRASNSQGE